MLSSKPDLTTDHISNSTSSFLHQKPLHEDSSKNKSLFPNSYWVSKKDEKRNHKRNNAPCKRWGHSVILFENQMFLFGGSGNNNNSRNWETIYILNCDTYEWEKVCPNDALGTNTPEPRDSHACVRIGNNMYIFGGSNGENPLNDMFAFNLVSKTWNKIDTIGDTPSPREGHSGVALHDRYFFIFGGWDGKNIFQNCYLFDYITKKWKLIEYAPGTEPLPRESHSCALLHDCIFIFGGQGTSIKKKDTYYNDLFRFKINIDKSLEKVSGVWEKLSSKNGIYPSPRTSHSIAPYKDKYLIVIGGEGYSSNNEVVNLEEQRNLVIKENCKNENEEANNEESDDDDNHPPCFPKSDIWIYDIEISSWNLLDVKNSEVFMPRFTHSCTVYKDSLIIFGGLKDFKNSIDDLIVLVLDDIDSKKPIHLCSCCKKLLDSEHVEEINSTDNNGKIGSELKKVEGIIEENESEYFEDNTNCKPFISLSCLSNLINLIGWPLAAFGLLVDNAILVDAKEVKIRWEKKFRYAYNPYKTVIKDQEHIDNFLIIEYNGTSSFFNEKSRILEGFLNFNENFKEDEARITFFKNLKYGGLRLGEVLFFVVKREKVIDLFYLSTNLKTNPDLNDYIVFNCSWNFITNEELSTNFLQNKKSIFDNISHLFTEQDLLDLTSNTTLFILNLRKVVSKNKLIYEISLNNHNEDICVVIPKILENPKIPPNNLVNHSLRKYLEYFFLQPPNNNFEIYLNNKKINFCNIWKDNINVEENFQTYKCLSRFCNNLKVLTQIDDYENNILSKKEEEKSVSKEQTHIDEDSILKTDKKLENIINDSVIQGLLLYQNNRLVRNMENYKKKGNISFFGYVELISEINLDFSKSNIENLALRTCFVGSLSNYMKEKKEEMKKLNYKKRLENSSISEMEPPIRKIVNN